MNSKTGVLISFAFSIVQTSGLVELPQVDDNNILTTEAAIRDTINTLFFSLRLKDVKNKARLKEYSTVHNHLVSITLQDYKNLKEIAKLTRVDKKNTNNETEGFICALNDLLNEDIEVEHEDYISYTNNVKNDDVVEYINQFLSNLESLKEEYGVNRENQRIKEDIYRTLKDKGNISFNYTKTDTKVDKSDERDAVLDDNEYWKPEELSGRRIYQGERVKIKYFPFMANVQIFNQFHCGGTILLNDLVITASSCLQLAYNNRFFRENPAFLSVRIGSHYYDGGESIGVFEVYFHPEYNPQNLRNNICMMRLIRKINFRKRHVKKIDFNRADTPLPENTDGITIIGWGAKGSNNIIQSSFHNQLSYAVLDMYPLRDCQDIYSKEYVTMKNFCAGFFSKGAGACNRDVGGPGIVNGKLMGVVSFGSPICGTPDAPTVFTKVGYYTNWIEEIMEQDVPSRKRKTTLRPSADLTLPPEYKFAEQTTFKIPPLTGTLKPIPINEVDALRMLQNSELFQEFLATMFGSKENDEYQDLLRQPDDDVTTTKESTPKTTKEKHSPTKSATKAFIDLRTSIGDVEPEHERISPMRVTMITSAEPAETVAPDNSFIKINKDADFEKELVNLIDNMDLKQIINNMSSLEEDKLLDDEKLFELLQDKNIDRNLTDVDDSILTLLYLSDSEKNQVNKKDLNVFDNDKNDEIRDGGLSIETDPFRDMTYRNRHNNYTVLNDVLLKQDLYDLLTDTINENKNKNK